MGVFTETTLLFLLAVDVQGFLWMGYRSANLTEVPHFAVWSRRIDLSFNKIASLPVGIFTKYKCLRFIRLEHNRISVLKNGSFLGLQSFDTLMLQDNNISVIEKGSFSGLRFLACLYLSDNKLSVIYNRQFSRLNLLRYLYLFLKWGHFQDCITLPSSGWITTKSQWSGKDCSQG